MLRRLPTAAAFTHLELLIVIAMIALLAGLILAAVGPVKAMVRSLDAGAIRLRMTQLLAKPPKDMRKALGDWARRHNVVVG